MIGSESEYVELQHFKIKCYDVSLPGLVAKQEREELPTYAPTLHLLFHRMFSLIREIEHVLAKYYFGGLNLLDVLKAEECAERLEQDLAVLNYVLSHPKCLEKW